MLTSVPCTESQGQPLPILAQRVEQQQALRCRHRPLAAACRVRSFCVVRKRTASRCVGPVTLRLQPIVETFLVDRESGEEFTAEQLDRPFQVL